MFPASSAANCRLLFLSLLGCFLCPHRCSTLSLQSTAPWSWEGCGWVLRRSLLGPLAAPWSQAAAWEATPEGKNPCGLHVWLIP